MVLCEPVDIPKLSDDPRACPPGHELCILTVTEDRVAKLEKELDKLRKEFVYHIEQHKTLDDQRRDLDTRLRKTEAYTADLNARLGRSGETITDLQRQLEELSGRLPPVRIDPSLNMLDSRGEFPLYRAAAGGHYNDAKRMLEQGAYPSMRTPFGWTALHWAANNGHANVVRLLLSYSADVNAVSDTGKRPLSMARTSEIRRLLQQKGGR